MGYLLKRQNRYYFNRRVPSTVHEFDSRKYIRIALKTDCYREAVKLAIAHNDGLEAYWNALLKAGVNHSQEAYDRVVKQARVLGFTYLTYNQVANLPFDNLYERLLHVEKQKYNQHHASAVMGAIKEPALKLNDALEWFLEFSKGKNLNKSKDQLRKWMHPRKRAISNFIKCIGNKDIKNLTRDDALKFRDWWIQRIEKEELLPLTANKNIIQIKHIVETVNDNLSLNIDTKTIFKKLLLDEGDENRRLSFETNYIISTLLNPENLNGLNSQARNALYAVAETGAGIAELVGLMPEDIFLDCEIPHIIIQPRQKKELKTKYRRRIIPVVGYALDAFKACPNGFTDYVDRPDSLSNTIGKYLRENDLLPSTNHSVYSLRHSFQDRLLAENAPDRVQADLMGHKFNRQSYGTGSSIEQKLEWLKKIQLKNALNLN